MYTYVILLQSYPFWHSIMVRVDYYVCLGSRRFIDVPNKYHLGKRQYRLVHATQMWSKVFSYVLMKRYEISLCHNTPAQHVYNMPVKYVN